MSDAIFRKQLGALRPVDDIAQAMMRDIKDGEHVKLAVPKRPRNAARHSYYWALLTVVVENTDHWPTPEALHHALKLYMGLVDEIVTVDGEIHLRPKSTSFASMDEPTFAAYLDKVVGIVCSKIIPGLDPMTLRMEAQARAA